MFQDWHAAYAENSQDPIHKCIIGEKGQNRDQSFHSCHMRVGLGQLEEEFRLQGEIAGLSVGFPDGLVVSF